MGAIVIRRAVEADAAALLAIYGPYVTDTAISFEWDVPTEAEFRRRLLTTVKKYPYLVAESDGEVMGYALTGPFVGRAAYAWGEETTIYLKRDCCYRGIGRRLYTCLEQVAKARGVQCLYACVAATDREDAYLTNNSVAFHRHLGYELVGTFPRCGYKFDRWYDMVWLEKCLAPPTIPAPPVTPFPDLDDATLAACGIK